MADVFLYAIAPAAAYAAARRSRLPEVRVGAVQPVMAPGAEDVDVERRLERLGLVRDQGRNVQDLTAGNINDLRPVLAEPEAQLSLDDGRQLLVLVLVARHDAALLEVDVRQHHPLGRDQPPSEQRIKRLPRQFHHLNLKRDTYASLMLECRDAVSGEALAGPGGLLRALGRRRDRRLLRRPRRVAWGVGRARGGRARAGWRCRRRRARAADRWEASAHLRRARAASAEEADHGRADRPRD